MRTAFLLAVATLAACATTGGSTLDSVLAGTHRTPANVERDQYRHPKQTLEFFGVRPDMTVVEVWPGRGWYAEILAPYVQERGRYYAAGFNTSSNPKAPKYMATLNEDFAKQVTARPEYAAVTITELGMPDKWTACPPGTADVVLTFRNVHNWLTDDSEDEMFAAFHAALKPGGTLGVVEHRARPGTSREVMKKSGYMTEAYVIELAEKAGFRLVAKSEINANPKDTTDYPDGVWTLPPVLRLKDKDREKYLAIGESDRMTLKFVKR